MERDLSIHQGFRLWQMRFLNPSRKGQLFHRKLPAPRGLPVDEPAFCLRFWKGNPMDGISFSERVLLPSSEERSFQAGNTCYILNNHENPFTTLHAGVHAHDSHARLFRAGRRLL